jgi:hypothetical protein
LTKIANLSPEINKSGVPGKDRTLPLNRIFSALITLRTRRSTPVRLVPIPLMRSETAFDFGFGPEILIGLFLHRLNKKLNQSQIFCDLVVSTQS